MGDGNFLRLTLIEAMPFVGNNSGVYVNLFDEIGKATGIKMVYDYGTCDSLVSVSSKGGADVVLGHTFINESVPADFGPVVYVDSMTGIAPKPVDLFVRRNLSKVFSPEVLPLLLAVYLAATVFNALIAKTKTTQHFSLMVFTSSYFFYCIIVEAIYVSKLASTFGTPSKTVKVTDEEVLYINEYDLYMSSSYYGTVGDLMNFTNVDWKKRHLRVVNASTLELFKFVALPENHATAGMFKSDLEMRPSEAMTVDVVVNKKNLNFRLFRTFHLRKRNALNPIVGYWAQEIVERGLVQKWLRDLSSANRNAKTERRALETPPVFVAFTLEYYQEVYALLFTGYVLALIVFASEFVVKDLERKIVRMKEGSRL